MGGDLYDVFGGVGVGGGVVGDYGFVQDCSWGFACVVNDLGEAGLGGGEGVAKLEEGFGDGAGGWAGEAEDADAAAAGRGGDGDDGVFLEVGSGGHGVGFLILQGTVFGFLCALFCTWWACGGERVFRGFACFRCGAFVVKTW